MSLTETHFEIVPFELEFETRRPGAPSRGAKRGTKPRSPYGSKYPHSPPFRQRRAGWTRSTLVGPYYDGAEPASDAGDAGAADDAAQPRPSEHVRWLQVTLNGALGLSLPVDGVMTPSVRDAIRQFQRQNRLPTSGYIGPDTESALRRSEAGGQQNEFEFALESELTGEELTAEGVLADRAKALPVATALKSLPRKPAVPGLYRFHAPNGKFYTGKSIDLRRRILQHVWCLSHFGKTAKGYRLSLYRMPAGTTEAQVRDLERAINLHHEANDKRLNKVTELEFLELNAI